MEVFRWPGGTTPVLKQSVATLGVFDGVHIGHQKVLREVVDEARRRGMPAVVITFDRHPHLVIQGPPQPAITSLEHRLRLFGQVGIDCCVVINFTQQVAEMKAADFARTVFRDLLHVRLLVLGFDCRFGRAREGDVALCRKLGRELGMESRLVPAVLIEGQIVSSTAIRRWIREADFRKAAKLLGRPFSLFGTVIGGAKRGRRFGYPTANLDVHNELLPPEGVYATWTILDGKRLESVTSVGIPLTFEPGPEPLASVEVHIMGVELELYGRDIEVEFVKWLREQRRYESAGALAEQIARDVEEARQFLARPQDRNPNG